MPCREEFHWNHHHNIVGWSVDNEPQTIRPCEKICGWCFSVFTRKQNLTQHLKNFRCRKTAMARAGIDSEIKKLVSLTEPVGQETHRQLRDGDTVCAATDPRFDLHIQRIFGELRHQTNTPKFKVENLSHDHYHAYFDTVMANRRKQLASATAPTTSTAQTTAPELPVILTWPSDIYTSRNRRSSSPGDAPKVELQEVVAKPIWPASRLPPPLANQIERKQHLAAIRARKLASISNAASGLKQEEPTPEKSTAPEQHADGTPEARAGPSKPEKRKYLESVVVESKRTPKPQLQGAATGSAEMTTEALVESQPKPVAQLASADPAPNVEIRLPVDESYQSKPATDEPQVETEEPRKKKARLDSPAPDGDSAMVDAPLPVDGASPKLPLGTTTVEVETEESREVEVPEPDAPLPVDGASPKLPLGTTAVEVDSGLGAQDLEGKISEECKGNEGLSDAKWSQAADRLLDQDDSDDEFGPLDTQGVADDVGLQANGQDDKTVANAPPAPRASEDVGEGAGNHPVNFGEDEPEGRVDEVEVVGQVESRARSPPTDTQPQADAPLTSFQSEDSDNGTEGVSAERAERRISIEETPPPGIADPVPKDQPKRVEDNVGDLFWFSFENGLPFSLPRFSEVKPILCEVLKHLNPAEFDPEQDILYMLGPGIVGRVPLHPDGSNLALLFPDSRANMEDEVILFERSSFDEYASPKSSPEPMQQLETQEDDDQSTLQDAQKEERFDFQPSQESHGSRPRSSTPAPPPLARGMNDSASPSAEDVATPKVDLMSTQWPSQWSVARRCCVAGCTHSTEFKRAANIIKHVQAKHKGEPVPKFD